MNRKYTIPLIALLVLSLVTLACGGGDETDTPVPPTNTPPPAPTNTPPPPPTDAPEPTEVPTEVPAAESIRQWATSAEASSQYGDPNWAAMQTTGAPDTAECGDYTSAWAAAGSSGVEWLEVYYDTPVYVTEVNIFQTYNPDQVVEVELIDMDGAYDSVYTQEPEEASECPYTLNLEGDPTEYLVQGVRITIDQSVLGLGWNEIDAVELVGVPGEAVSVPDKPKPVSGLEPGWSYYTNGNYVRGIALDGNTLWAATGGGVVAWDLAGGDVAAYTVLNGLPTNDIHDIVVCPLPDTTVVAATEAGLAVYDPNSDTWEQMTTENSGLEKNGVDDLDCDPAHGILLISYDFGVGFWEPAEDDWLFMGRNDGLISEFSDQVLVTEDEIWIVGPFGLSVVQIDDGSVTTYDEDNSDIPDENTSGVAIDANGDVWLAAFDGLIKFSGGAWKLYNSDNVEEFPFLDAFERVIAAPDGTIWAGNVFGDICQFDPAAETCVVLHDGEDGMISGLDDMIMDENGNVFYCDNGDGISMFNGSSWMEMTLDELPQSNAYYAITQTPDGTIWVGGSFGLHTFSVDNPDAWKHNDMDGYSINTFYLGEDGIWIGHGGGASYAEYGTDEWLNLSKAEEAGEGIYKGGVMAITEDGSGRVWFGTSGGLTVWDGDTYVYHDLLTDTERADKKSPRTVYALVYDGTGIWVGTWGGLFYIDENDDVAMWDELSTGTPYVEALALDVDGSVLIGESRDLLRYNGQNFLEVVEADADINSILVLESGELWLGLEYAGVGYYDGGEWWLMTTEDGLPTGHYNRQGVLVDNMGTLWFAGAEGGLARYVPEP